MGGLALGHQGADCNKGRRKGRDRLTKTGGSPYLSGGLIVGDRWGKQGDGVEGLVFKVQSSEGWEEKRVG